MSPDAGDYGAWAQLCVQLVDRWAPGWAQAGVALSLQQRRDTWFQLDIDPRYAVGLPVAPPMPQQRTPPSEESVAKA